MDQDMNNQTNAAGENPGRPQGAYQPPQYQPPMYQPPMYQPPVNSDEYRGDPRFQPLSPWAYFGYNILFSLPIIGFIMLIVFSFSDENINRRNYARSFWCALLLGVILFAVILVAAIAMGVARSSMAMTALLL